MAKMHQNTFVRRALPSHNQGVPTSKRRDGKEGGFPPCITLDLLLTCRF